MRIIKAIFIKQFLSYFKKAAIIGTPLSFLGFGLVFTVFIPEADGAFGNLFGVMFVGLSMVGAAGSFIMEDRATMNLRFMSMAGVKPYQYLLGTGTALFVSSIGFLIAFALIGRNFAIADFTEFMAITILGSITSIIVGATLALSKFPWLFQPVSMILGFGIILADANETIERVFYFTYTQQINIALRSGYEYEEGYGYIFTEAPNAIPIILANMAVAIVLFAIGNMRYGLYRDNQ